MAVSDYLSKLHIDMDDMNAQLSNILGQKYFNKVDVVTTKYTIGSKGDEDTYVLFRIKNGEAINKVDEFKFTVLDPENIFIVDEVEL